MRIIVILSLIATGIAYSDVAVDPWEGNELSKIITLGDDETKIKINLLEPLAVHTTGSGGANDGSDLHIWRLCAGDHGFVYTSAGDLFIDNLYAGRFDDKDVLHYGNGRFWSGAKPHVLTKISDAQKAVIYSDPFFKQKDGTDILETKPYRILLKPVSGSGGGSGGGSQDNQDLVRCDGMTVMRITQGQFYLQGVLYGKITKGNVIRVIDGVVSINGKVRFPVSSKNNK